MSRTLQWAEGQTERVPRGSIHFLKQASLIWTGRTQTGDCTGKGACVSAGLRWVRLEGHEELLGERSDLYFVWGCGYRGVYSC